MSHMQGGARLQARHTGDRFKICPQVERRSRSDNTADEFFAKLSKQIHYPHMHHSYYKTQRPAKPFYVAQFPRNKIRKQRLKPFNIKVVYSGNEHFFHINLVMKFFHK